MVVLVEDDVFLVVLVEVVFFGAFRAALAMFLSRRSSAFNLASLILAASLVGEEEELVDDDEEDEVEELIGPETEEIRLMEVNPCIRLPEVLPLLMLLAAALVVAPLPFDLIFFFDHR